ncbi:hypothetical protein BU26DRAFT_559783 [Trematosphaeria pertusa]|uniref:RING-type domain-containing protein n=1 Tax=Trematosphaeria pertusa TaxID=390896 RepID=A0A6A6J155_9PLEO|nr:uncharacterized protein BU26DRAFT_559783 [Trematosphaeria pertusa]KAF2255163.1 hypothetical protein BU26DRAFT_559783 [Trematosphaeria pertusa]
MPYRIDDSIISNFLTTHTRPIRLSSLPQDPSSQHCPICHLPYAPQDPSYVHPLHPPDTPEYPVQVRCRGPCKHVFGRICIERHMRGGQPWSHTCPICRAEWFPAPNAGRREVLAATEIALDALARIDAADVEVRAEVERVEEALRRIREVLYGSRWI